MKIKYFNKKEIIYQFLLFKNQMTDKKTQHKIIIKQKNSLKDT